MSDLQEIFETVDLTEWLDYEAIDWKRTSGGDNVQIRECPFCGDSRWRVYFSRSKLRGLCFHGECQERFNLFSFSRAFLHAENAATVDYWHRYAGLSGRHTRHIEKNATPTPRDDWKLPESIPIPTSDDMTHPYLLSRGVTLSTQRLFDLRWCESGKFSYNDVDGTPRQMYFGQRILVPIYDLDGSMISFVGRDVSGSAAVRYLFPPLLPVAGKILFGGQIAKGSEHLIIGEGPFDTTAIHQALAEHPDFRKYGAIGSFGLSIGSADENGDDQLGRLLSLRNQHGLKSVTFMWDGEENALKSALNNASVISRHGLAVKIAFLPKDTDPGEVDSRTIRDAIVKAETYSQALHMRCTIQNPYK